MRSGVRLPIPLLRDGTMSFREHRRDSSSLGRTSLAVAVHSRVHFTDKSRLTVAVQVISDNDTATLLYHPESGIVHHECHKFIFGEPLRALLMSGCDVLTKNHATKWLSDDRGNSAIGKEDTEWAQTVWFPTVKAAGWKHWAVVLPAKVVGQLNMKQWVGLYSSLGINAQVFSDPDEAMKWLIAQ
jgi:hypothetical protein